MGLFHLHRDPLYKVAPTDANPSPPVPAFQPTEPFRPAPGLSSPNAQTTFATLFRPRQAPPVARERWDTPDGDFVELDWLRAQPRRPHVVIFHGLEGSSQSGYVRATFRHAAARGYGAVAFNFRSCSGELNRQLRSYNSGDTGAALWVLERLRQRLEGPLWAVGFSLGANVLVRTLAAGGAKSLLDRAVAVSTPFDLTTCAAALDGPGPWAQLYRTVFLRSLRRKALAKARTFPEALAAAAIKKAASIEAFDDAVTAPVWGFASARDYYAHSSSLGALKDIRRPTLLLSAADDPLVPPSALPSPELVASNPALSAHFTERGGHVGFVAGSVLRPSFWAEEQAVAFLAS
jgi:predicted alpha/beta-fold hydrolase